MLLLVNLLQIEGNSCITEYRSNKTAKY